MTRGLGLASLLVALAIAGWLVTAQLRSSGTTAPRGLASTQAAAGAASGAALAQAALALDTAKAVAGTYAGVATSVPGVTVVRADATSYCVQAADAHLAGPGGAPAPGPC